MLLLTLTAVYLQETRMAAIYFALGFGLLGYLMRRLDVPILPFVISFILAGSLEDKLRQAFAGSGADPWFLFRTPLSVAFLALAVLIAIYLGRGRATSNAGTPSSPANSTGDAST
ncbi:MAG: hypothetical protein R3E48_12120 [Burkholderiaceae bacterium]